MNPEYGAVGQETPLVEPIDDLIVHERRAALEACRGLVARGVTGRLEVWGLFTEEFQPDAVFGERGVSASG
jgi:hypothetical protein